MPLIMFSYNKRTFLKYKSIAVVCATVMLVFISCNNDRKLVTSAVVDRDSIAAMTTYDVESFISDSGIIRYKIVAAEWQVYDKKDPPYWAFEKGLYVEKFDTLFNVEASIKADTAYYNTRDQIWTLRGNVDVANLKGESFHTQLLHWNQKTERVYSDKYIKIVQVDKTIEGVGFDSNQQMTEYEISNITGIFTVDDSKDVEDNASVDSISSPETSSDSLQIKKRKETYGG